jgi:hypothetical protein
MSSSANAGTVDPLVHFFWTRLTPRVQRVVKRNARAIYARLADRAAWAPLNCEFAAGEWAAAFTAAGVPVEVISGVYDASPSPFVEPTLSADHVWLVVDGELVDPTAAQFLRYGPIRADRYFPRGTHPSGV